MLAVAGVVAIDPDHKSDGVSWGKLAVAAAGATAAAYGGAGADEATGRAWWWLANPMDDLSSGSLQPTVVAPCFRPDSCWRKASKELSRT